MSYGKWVMPGASPCADTQEHRSAGPSREFPAAAPPPSDPLPPDCLKSWSKNVVWAEECVAEREGRDKGGRGEKGGQGRLRIALGVGMCFGEEAAALGAEVEPVPSTQHSQHRAQQAPMIPASLEDSIPLPAPIAASGWGFTVSLVPQGTTSPWYPQ